MYSSNNRSTYWSDGSICWDCTFDLNDAYAMRFAAEVSVQANSDFVNEHASSLHSFIDM